MNGRDITVEFTSAEDAGKSFPVTTIRVKSNQTPITEDDKLLDRVINEQPNIQEMYQERSYEELTEVLNNWLTPSDEEESKDDSGASVSNEVLSKQRSKILQKHSTSSSINKIVNITGSVVTVPMSKELVCLTLKMV